MQLFRLFGPCTLLTGAALQAGLDSLGAVELRNALHHEMGVSLPATFAFDHPTIASMAIFMTANVRTEASQAITGMLDQESSAQAQDLVPQLQAMTKDILGADIPATQPLMEVCCPAMAHNLQPSNVGVQIPPLLDSWVVHQHAHSYFCANMPACSTFITIHMVSTI